MTLLRLDITQSYQLMNLVKEEFVSSNFNDTEFAEYATGKLKFFVNNDHVKTRRNALGIEPKTPRKVPEKTVETFLTLVKELEERVAKLEARSK
jgi:hypothetical protein